MITVNIEIVKMNIVIIEINSTNSSLSEMFLWVRHKSFIQCI